MICAGLVNCTYNPLLLLNEIYYRKLLAIDYVGTALTLIGCTLVILPLIWVNDFSIHSGIHVFML